MALKANTTTEVVVRACESVLKSLTYDRGKEMTLHGLLSHLLGIDVYFADPHAPWQRGTNENTNGLIRDFFPKGTDFSGCSEEDVLKVQVLLNTRPRKILGFQTPESVLSTHLRCRSHKAENL